MLRHAIWHRSAQGDVILLSLVGSLRLHDSIQGSSRRPWRQKRPGLDFAEAFLPVARMRSFKMILAVAARLGLKVYGGDVATAYLKHAAGR